MEGKMKPCHLLAAIAVVSSGILSCGGSSGPSNTFGTQLTGANEVPAVSSTATGTVSLTLNGATVNYTVSATGLPGDARQSHVPSPGRRGPGAGGGRGAARP